MYRTIFFAPDGHYVQEGYFETKEEAQNHIDNIGSRWFFFPFAFICTENRTVFTESGRKKLKTMVHFIDGFFNENQELTSDDMHVAYRIMNNF